MVIIYLEMPGFTVEDAIVSGERHYLIESIRIQLHCCVKHQKGATVATVKGSREAELSSVSPVSGTVLGMPIF